MLECAGHTYLLTDLGPGPPAARLILRGPRWVGAPSRGQPGRLDRVEDALELGQRVATGFLEQGVGLDPQVIRLDQHRHQSLVASRRLTHVAVLLSLVPDYVLRYHSSTLPPCPWGGKHL